MGISRPEGKKEAAVQPIKGRAAAD